MVAALIGVMTAARFNEAEAIKPRILACKPLIWKSISRRFNEAEAIKPRIRSRRDKKGDPRILLQ